MTSASAGAASVPTYFKCKVDDTQPDLKLGPCQEPVSTEAQVVQQPAESRPMQPSADAQYIQNRFYASKDGMPGDYYLSVVEFDDQGWFAERKQMDALFALLDTLEKEDRETGGHTLIYVYAHGWKHNANACDNNVMCFSHLLERTDLVEQSMNDEGSNRKVVGVYVGWRGLPFETALNNVSFWNRKDTAARVGRGGVFELLTRLNDYRNNRMKDYCLASLKQTQDSERKSKKSFQWQRDNLLKAYPDCANYTNSTEVPRRADPGNAPTQLIITGHSFGGLVIYSALSHALMERAAKTITDANGTHYDRAKSFGDFVMLVNPAFEGSLYEPLFQIATHRTYEDTQRPVMMIVTSTADSDTGSLFPIGRTLNTIFQRATSTEQTDSMRKAIGHDVRYMTHQLVSDGKPAKKRGDDNRCPYLRQTSLIDVEKELMPLYKTNISNQICGAFGEYNPIPYGEDVMLVPVPWTCSIKDVSFKQCMSHGPTDLSPKYASHYPYLVVSTDAGVIADHNAIYNERFLDFAMTFIYQHIAQPKPWTLTRQAAAGVECSSNQDGMGARTEFVLMHDACMNHRIYRQLHSGSAPHLAITGGQSTLQAKV